MQATSFNFRYATICLIAVCSLVTAGCDKKQDKPADQATPAAAPPTPAASGNTTAPATQDNMISKTPVTGNEALPPNHPPLPAGMPAHPAGPAIKEADINQQLAAQHPSRSGNKKLDVAVPANVAGKWVAANIAVTANGEEKKIRLAIGDKISLGKNLQLHLLHYLPAYTSDFKSVTSSSEQEINPAIQLQAISGEKVVAEGWVFQMLPEFNSFKSDQLTVRLISAEKAQAK